MNRQRGTKHGYELFLLLHSPFYTLVWRPHSIYYMNHGYYSIFHKYTILVLSHQKLVLINPSPFRLRDYQWQTSSDLRLRLYTYGIHLLAVVYILHIPLWHLRSKGFTSLYFTNKPVVREISRYIPDHKAFDAEVLKLPDAKEDTITPYIATTNSISIVGSNFELLIYFYGLLKPTTSHKILQSIKCH